jgi:hypothetical protein
MMVIALIHHDYDLLELAEPMTGTDALEKWKRLQTKAITMVGGKVTSHGADGISDCGC